MSGDTRAAEMPSLASFHTLFLREHNRLALEISKVCCDGDDGLIFQRARRIAIAEFQNVVYSEFLPKLLGFRTIYQYRLEVDQRSVYDPTVNPTIRNAFSTAAFRFGHSMVWNNITLVNDQGDWFREYHIRDKYFQDDIPMSMEGRGVDFIMNGMAVQPGGAVDLSIVEDLTNYLFINSSGVTGADLIARNIQRGRDHGLPPYNEYRKYCGLAPACTWELKPPEISFQTWDFLRDLYDSPQDIDLYVGGLAEEQSQESMLGKTFTCLIAKQFHNLKFGDRFFYTHLSPQPEVIFPFTDDQIFNIRSRKMRDIVCDNTLLPNFPEYPFRLHSKMKSCSEKVPVNMDLFSDAYENQAAFNEVPW